MAKISKNEVMISISKMRNDGMNDSQIMNRLFEKKKYKTSLKAIVGKARNAGSKDPYGDTAKIFGLDIHFNKTSQEDRKNKATLGEKVESYAMSGAQGMANIVGGGLQGIAYAGDKVNEGINSVFGTNLETNAYEAVTKDYKNMNKVTNETAYNVGRLDKETDTDWVSSGTEMVASAPFMLSGGGVIRAGLSGAGVGAMGYAEDGQKRMSNIAGGAIGGVGGHLTGEMIGKGVKKFAPKLINTKKGKLKDEYKEIDDLAKQHGINASVGDITQDPLAQKTEVTLENVPFVGISKFREAQHSQAKESMMNVTGKLKSMMNETDYKALPKLEQSAKKGDRNAQRILDKIEDAGTDTPKVIQASAEVRAWREGQVANKMYNKVDDEVAKLADDTVSVEKTLQSLDNKIASEQASLAPDQELLGELTSIRSRFANPNVAKNFGNIQKARSQLGNLAEKHGSGANPNKSASAFYGDLKKAMDGDIDNFVATKGTAEVKRLYNRANSFYKSVQKRKDTAIAKSMQSNKPDEIFDAFVKTGKGDRAKNFYNSLDAKGQSALRYQMAENAMYKSVNPSTGDFSPAKFAGEFERMREPYKELFKGEDKSQIDGFVKLMRHIERSGQYKENPPTGNRLTGVLMGGAVAFNPVTGAQAGVLSAIAKALLTTKGGKNLLLASNKLDARQTKALDNILSHASQLTATVSSRSAIQVQNSVSGTKVDEKNIAPAF